MRQYPIMSKTVYPLEELELALSPKQLQILKDQVDSEQPTPSPQSLFNYGWGLIKASTRKQQQEGVTVLAHLYRDVPSMRRECLYYLSLGSYKTGDYTNARRYVETLLHGEPDNAQAQALKQSIEDKITRDGLIGLGIAGGAIAITLGIIGSTLRRKR